MGLTANKKLALALAAISMYEEEEARAQAASLPMVAACDPGYTSAWVVSGRQESMFMRTMLQRRMGVGSGLR